MTPSTLTPYALEERIAKLESTLAQVLGVLRANEELWQAFVNDWATCNPSFGSLEGYNEVNNRRLPDLARQTARLPELVA